MDQQTAFSFGRALEALKQGQKVARKGWNGKGMWLYLALTPPTTALEVDDKRYGFLPYIEIKTVEGKMCPWVSSQTDLLSDDWFIF